jgi:site-specific recombinase XerD
MTISYAFDRYRRDKILFGNQSRKTEEHHAVALKNLIRFTGDIELSELTFDLVREWKFDMESRLSSDTVRGYLIKLRVVLKYAQRLGEDCLDPELIPLPKRTDKVPNFFTAEQVKLLIDSTSSLQAKTIISMLYASGLRVSELCSLDRNDLRDDCSFTVVGKRGKARLCFIDKRTCNYLKQLLDTRDDNNPALFISRLSKKRVTPSNVQEIFKHLRKKNNMVETISPHWLRHSFATNLMQNNAHIYTVSRLMGHSSIETTSVYLHISDSHLQEEYKKHHSI